MSDDDDVPANYQHLLHKFGELNCDSSCYYCFGVKEGWIQLELDVKASDRYRRLIDAAAFKQFEVEHELFNFLEFEPLKEMLDKAKNAAKKQFISLEKFKSAKSFENIRSLIFHCRYPERRALQQPPCHERGS